FPLRCEDSAACLSLPFDLHDRQLDLARRPADGDAVAFAPAQKRAPERGLVADPPRAEPVVELLSADDLIGRPVALLVLHGDRRPEEDAVPPRPRSRIDHLARFDLLLQAVEARV